jgi:hypothetical protein
MVALRQWPQNKTALPEFHVLYYYLNISCCLRIRCVALCVLQITEFLHVGYGIKSVQNCLRYYVPVCPLFLLYIWRHARTCCTHLALSTAFSFLKTLRQLDHLHAQVRLLSLDLQNRSKHEISVERHSVVRFLQIPADTVPVPMLLMWLIVRTSWVLTLVDTPCSPFIPTFDMNSCMRY